MAKILNNYEHNLVRNKIKQLELKLSFARFRAWRALQGVEAPLSLCGPPTDKTCEWAWPLKAFHFYWVVCMSVPDRNVTIPVILSFKEQQYGNWKVKRPYLFMHNIFYGILMTRKCFIYDHFPKMFTKMMWKWPTLTNMSGHRQTLEGQSGFIHDKSSGLIVSAHK